MEYTKGYHKSKQSVYRFQGAICGKSPAFHTESENMLVSHDCISPYKVESLPNQKAKG